MKVFNGSVTLKDLEKYYGNGTTTNRPVGTYSQDCPMGGSDTFSSFGYFYYWLCRIFRILFGAPHHSMVVGKLAAKILVLGINMSTGFQNPFSQQPSPLTPGRVITKVKRYVSPTGKVVELRWLTKTVLDNQGIFTTEETIEVVPPLSDGTTPQDSDKIRECFRCQCLIHEENYRVCPLCGLGFGLPCTTIIKTESEEVRVCVYCAKNVRHPFLQAAKRILWG